MASGMMQFLTALVLFASAGPGPHDYRTQYEEAQREGSLVMLVSAAWCQPCRELKQKLDAAGADYAVLDVDDPQDRIIIDGYVIGRQVPRFVIAVRRRGVWTTYRFKPGEVPEAVLRGPDKSKGGKP